MRQLSATPRYMTLAAILLLGIWFWVANDGRLHWDEPAYLYAAAYFDAAEILEGDFQPTGVAYFNAARILHVLFVRSLYAAFGVIGVVVTLVIVVYTAFTLGSLYIGFLVLRKILPAEPWVLATGVLLTMFAPGFLWLSFKSLPEAPALFLASLSVLSLLKSFERRPIIWILLGATSLAAVALFKATLALMFGSFALVLLFFSDRNYTTRKVLSRSLAVGATSLILFFATLSLFGISLEQYLASGTLAREFGAPLISRLVFTVMEAGLLLVAVPLAFLHSDRRSAYFMLTWFCLATIPLLFVLTYIEPRYLLSNLIPLIGLVALSLEGVGARLRGSFTRTTVRVGLAAAMSALIASGASAQWILAHEVVIWDVRRAIDELDERFGSGEYTIVVPWLYSDFHYLRVAYPDLRVYTVFTPRVNDPVDYELERFYGDRTIGSLAELELLPEPIIYFGFEESMPLTNLRMLARNIPVGGLSQRLDAMIEQVSNESHFNASWMYTHPRIELSPLERYDYYMWAEVSVAGD